MIFDYNITASSPRNRRFVPVQRQVRTAAIDGLMDVYIYQPVGVEVFHEVSLRKYRFTVQNNDQLNIPDTVMSQVIRVTRDTHVIDFGAGRTPNMHIDFGTAHHTRIDLDGVISTPHFSSAQTLPEAIRQTPTALPVTLVFFRAFSCLDARTLLNLKRTVKDQKSRIDTVVVYDYAINQDKFADYKSVRNQLGSVLSKRAEWYDGVFYHYQPSQVAAYFGMSSFSSQACAIPAVKEASSPGFLLIGGF